MGLNWSYPAESTKQHLPASLRWNPRWKRKRGRRRNSRIRDTDAEQADRIILERSWTESPDGLWSTWSDGPKKVNYNNMIIFREEGTSTVVTRPESSPRQIGDRGALSPLRHHCSTWLNMASDLQRSTMGRQTLKILLSRHRKSERPSIHTLKKGRRVSRVSLACLGDTALLEACVFLRENSMKMKHDIPCKRKETHSYFYFNKWSMKGEIGNWGAPNLTLGKSI